MREQPAAAVTAILEYEGGGAAAPIVMRSSGRGAHHAPANPGREFRPRAAACARRVLARAAPKWRGRAVRSPSPRGIKCLAALQAAQGGPAAMLLKLESTAGHGGGNRLKARLADTADIYAFVLKSLGVER